jgi:hypothetical protein
LEPGLDAVLLEQLHDRALTQAEQFP